MSQPTKKKLGELLLELGLIDRDQLTSALAYQRHWGHRLGASLVAKGFISEGTLIHVLSHSLGIPMVDLSQVRPEKEALKLIPLAQCEAHEMLPLAIEETKGRRTLVLAMADPMNFAVQEEVAFTTGCRVKPVIAGMTAMTQAIRAWMKGVSVDISPVTYDKPLDRQLKPDEEFTLVHTGGEERILSSPLLPPVESSTQNTPLPQATPTAFGKPPTGSGALPPVAPPVAYSTGVELSNPAGSPRPFSPQAMPPTLSGVPTAPMPLPPPAVLLGAQTDPVEELEKKYWALMRVLARKGIITKEEFLRELGGNG